MKNSKRAEYIDVWRFFAIALVIVSHLIEFSHPFYKDILPGLIWRMHPVGQLGVYVFFCVSGYVICRGMAYEVSTYGSFNMRNFYIRRAFRILPPLAVYLLFIAFMAWVGVFDVTLLQIAKSAAFLCNIQSLGGCSWYLGHTWSLAFEEQFYLIFPLIFAVMALALNRSKLLGIVLILIATSVVVRMLSYPELAYYLSIFSYMLWGCVYALYQDKFEPILKTISVPVWSGLGILLLGLNFVVMPATFWNYVYPVITPLLICVLVFGTPLRHPVVHKFFTNRLIAYLGQISYTVYLWQQITTKDYGFASPLVAILLTLSLFVLAYLSYQYFEIPLIRAGRNLSARRVALAPEVASAAIIDSDR